MEENGGTGVQKLYYQDGQHQTPNAVPQGAPAQAAAADILRQLEAEGQQIEGVTGGDKGSGDPASALLTHLQTLLNQQTPGGSAEYVAPPDQSSAAECAPTGNQDSYRDYGEGGTGEFESYRPLQRGRRVSAQNYGQRSFNQVPSSRENRGRFPQNEHHQDKNSGPSGSTDTLFLTGFPAAVQQREIEAIFLCFKGLREVRVPEPKVGATYRHAFVEFQQPDFARDAMESCRSNGAIRRSYPDLKLAYARRTRGPRKS